MSVEHIKVHGTALEGNLEGDTVDSVNTFDVPNTVVPKPVSAKAQDGKLTLELEPKSVTVIALQQ